MQNRRTIVLLSLLALGVCGYLGFIRKYCSPYAGGSDSSGYLNATRLMRQGSFVAAVPPIEGLAPPAWNYFYQQPLGFRVNVPEPTMTPTYPLGLPLHLAIAASFVDLDYAAIPVNMVLALAAAGLTVALARRFGLPWSWAVACAALLWACPLYVSYTLQPMSDHPATVWVLAAVWLALKVRDRPAWGFAAGFAVAAAVLVRPSNLLVVAPVAVALGFKPRAWASLAVGGLPGAVLLGCLNRSLWGSPFRTGYGPVESLFQISYVPHNALHFALWLTLLLSPPVTIAALGLFRIRRRHPLFAALAATWFGSFVLFYVFYFYSGEVWWYLRFIMPVFPVVIVAAALVLHDFVHRPDAARSLRPLPAVLLAFALVWDVALGRHLDVHFNKATDMGYLLAADWARQHLPPNAIVLQMQLSGAFAYYTDFTMVRWDLLDRDTSWPLLRQAARTAHRPIYAVLDQFEPARAWPGHVPGRWRRLAQVRQMSVWELTDADAAPAGGS